MADDPADVPPAGPPSGLTPGWFIVLSLACAAWTGATCGLLLLPGVTDGKDWFDAFGDASFKSAFELACIGAIVGGLAGMWPAMIVAGTRKESKPLRWSAPASAAALAAGAFAATICARDPFVALGAALVGMLLGFVFDAAAAARGIRPGTAAVLVGTPSAMAALASVTYRLLRAGG